MFYFGEVFLAGDAPGLLALAKPAGNCDKNNNSYLAKPAGNLCPEQSLSQGGSWREGISFV
jgi:hypothetical protein